jgi:hypothetical protein
MLENDRVTNSQLESFKSNVKAFGDLFVSSGVKVMRLEIIKDFWVDLLYLGRRRRSVELGLGLRFPREGPLLSATGVTYGTPEGSCAPVMRIKS